MPEAPSDTLACLKAALREWRDARRATAAGALSGEGALERLVAGMARLLDAEAALAAVADEWLTEPKEKADANRTP